MSRRGGTPTPPVIYDAELTDDDGHLCVQKDGVKIPLRFRGTEDEPVYQNTNAEEFDVLVSSECSQPPLCGDPATYESGPFVEASYAFDSCTKSGTTLNARILIVLDSSNVWRYNSMMPFPVNDLTTLQYDFFEKLT